MTLPSSIANLGCKAPPLGPQEYRHLQVDQGKTLLQVSAIENQGIPSASVCVSV